MEWHCYTKLCPGYTGEVSSPFFHRDYRHNWSLKVLLGTVTWQGTTEKLSHLILALNGCSLGPCLNWVAHTMAYLVQIWNREASSAISGGLQYSEGPRELVVPLVGDSESDPENIYWWEEDLGKWMTLDFNQTWKRNEMLWMEVAMTNVVVSGIKWIPNRTAMPSPTYPWHLSEKQNTIGLDRLGWAEMPVLSLYDFPLPIGELPRNILPGV